MILYTHPLEKYIKGRYSGGHMTIYGSILPGEMAIVK